MYGSSDEDVHDSAEGAKYGFIFVVRCQLDEGWQRISSQEPISETELGSHVPFEGHVVISCSKGGVWTMQFHSSLCRFRQRRGV